MTALTHSYWLRGLLFGLLLWLLAGCAGYSDNFAPIAAELAGHKLDAALELLDKKEPPARDRLLRLMNRGMLLRLKGSFSASNQEFAAAKQLVEQLNALSLREQTTALIVNDTARSYAGAPYEQVMLNLYSALNYLNLGQLDAARVEALQVDLLLGELADKELGALFENDPFARYLSGLIYEAGGEYSDAMIAYRLAYQAYQQHAQAYPLSVPKQLQIDLLRSSERLGLVAENRRYREQFGMDNGPMLEQQGELIFLFHNGLAPVKIEQSITLPVPPHGQFVRIALPEYQRRPRGFSAARLLIDGQLVVTELVENIAELAVAELAANRPAMIARLTARSLLKYQLSREAGKKNDLAGFLVNIAGLLSERADTRSWLSLPAEIQLARVALSPGEYVLDVELLDPAGRVVERLTYPAVVLRTGEKTFLSGHGIAETSLLGRK